MPWNVSVWSNKSQIRAAMRVGMGKGKRENEERLRCLCSFISRHRHRRGERDSLHSHLPQWKAFLIFQDSLNSKYFIANMAIVNIHMVLIWLYGQITTTNSTYFWNKRFKMSHIDTHMSKSLQFWNYICKKPAILLLSSHLKRKLWIWIQIRRADVILPSNMYSLLKWKGQLT